MRKDELEKFVEQHRDEFDAVESFNTEMVWEGIESNRKKNLVSIAKIALVLLFLILSVMAALFVKSVYAQNQSFETLAGLTDDQELKRDEMIKFVSLKEQKLKEKNVDMSSLSEFANELEGLDEIEQLIMGDFTATVNKEKLVKSMLQYYESKARILELILLEIENKENNENFEQEIY